MRRSLALVLVPLLGLSFVLPGTALAANTTHVIAFGETLTSIAAQHGVTVAALAEANHLASPNLIYAGQALIIPGAADGPAPPAAPNAAQNTYTVQAGDTLSGIAARYDTTVAALVAANNLSSPDLVYAGQVLRITGGSQTGGPAAGPPGASGPAPPSPAGAGKWIDVDLSEQALGAYDGQTQVYYTRVSTGLPGTPTPTGTFRIYAKLRFDDMTGGSGADYYYLPRVPNVMYFYMGGYALHGTYWHNNFGRPMSRGCVNLNLQAAQWIYDWAPSGTPVVIHN